MCASVFQRKSHTCSSLCLTVLTDQTMSVHSLMMGCSGWGRQVFMRTMGVFMSSIFKGILNVSFRIFSCVFYLNKGLLSYVPFLSPRAWFVCVLWCIPSVSFCFYGPLWADHEKTGRTKVTIVRRASIIQNKLILSLWIFSCLLLEVILLEKYADISVPRLLLHGVFLLPWFCTCFKRSFLPDVVIFHLLVPSGFNHTSITKQTNKFRAYTADTNIDMSYEIQRSRERLSKLMHNICAGQRRAARNIPRQSPGVGYWTHCLVLGDRKDGDRTGTKWSLLSV